MKESFYTIHLKWDKHTYFLIAKNEPDQLTLKDQSKRTKFVFKVVLIDNIKHFSAVIDNEVKIHFLNQKTQRIKSENIKKCDNC